MGGVIPLGLLELLAWSYRDYGVMGVERSYLEVFGVIDEGL